MVMSQGTYTFLACFAGFWLIWALIVMLCCFCSFAQRKLKRRREERLREQCLRALEMEPLDCGGGGYPPREQPQFCPPLQMMSPQVPVTHTLPQGNWNIPEGKKLKIIHQRMAQTNIRICLVHLYIVLFIPPFLEDDLYFLSSMP